ncbi:Mur ligase family protein [Ileibacterium valens]|uniref:Lipid II isoglutaminyl synthase (glutamine-hydrolyzing) subunit MurT n=1 Tax=Ileibacterium valens TaxID=1862668 RepID=A0A1U7NI73_9FIRM|nr:Mur ligase family protein [Ileibacterium valens]OLU37685.1 ligase [Erysipelotrichaceae bacterium NYU-BL-E8]OLU37782.1 ligase [Erysipelotrichaceae bacterium NYU-BL-F16]OLU41983.1 ligase [Ileibacterium valens]
MSLLSIAAVKLSSSVLKLAGRGGSLPGEIGLKLDPASLKKLKINGPVVLVTGTNGKTSTANLIASVFEASGYEIISNRKGDNLREGITTALLSNASLSGSLGKKALILEVDELNVRHILPNLPVSALVVNNFFRDQLDRAREMEQLIESIESVLGDYCGTLILNGNDPNTYRLSLKAPKAKVVSFGLDENRYSVKSTTEASEGKFCPKCSHPLEYDYYQYSHIGKFHCTHCDFQSPDLDVMLQDVNLDENTFELNSTRFKGPYEGMYSMYNYAALFGVMKEFGLPNDAAIKVFGNAPHPFGRNERFEKKGREVILNLIKNPTGANEVMKVIEREERRKNVVIVLNDREQDGRDVSWIYDTQFEKILNDSTNRIVCTGLRRNDMALRLYYSGFDPKQIHVTDSLQDALHQVFEEDLPIFVVATYTALRESRNIIEKEIAA